MDPASGDMATLRFLKMSRLELRVFLVGCLFSLLVRGSVMIPLVYTPDDWARHGLGANPFMDPTSMSARWGWSFIDLVTVWLGVDAPAVGPLYAAMLTVALVWMAVAACRLWGIAEDPLAFGFVTLFFVLHPYQSELFTYRLAHLPYAMAFFLGASSLSFRGKSIGDLLASVVLIALSISIYQPILSYVAAVVFVNVVLQAVRMHAAEGLRWRALLRATGLLRDSIAMGAGVAVYFAGSWVLQSAFGIHSPEKTRFLLPDMVRGRATEAVLLLKRIFVESEPVAPASLKVLLLALAAIGFGAALRQALSRSWGHGLRLALLICAALVVAVICVPGLGLFAKLWWPTPRSLSHVSVIWAGTMAFAAISASARSKPWLWGLATLIVFAQAGLNSRILSDQAQVHARDMSLANRIAARIEALPGAERIQSLAVIPSKRQAPASVRSRMMDLNISAFETAWSATRIVNQMTGIGLHDPSGEEARSEADAHCEAAPKWPAPGSVSALGSLAAVCL